jgi:riboflavin kinase/FMN adenylyltransferase
VGTFDGVHIGHRKILSRLRELAAKLGGESVLVTFDPHPRIALKKDAHKLKLLNTLEEKAGLLNEAGIDHLVVLSFTPEFATMSEQEFVASVLVEKLKIYHLVVGFNHRFGHDRHGDFVSLQTYGEQYGFGVEEIPREELQDLTVSSTLIRNALIEDHLDSANRMLGQAYRITAIVVDGNKKGRTLGFPTANLRIDHPYKLIPVGGVYAVRVLVDGKTYDGMCNIGVRPTFGGNFTVTEVNIFNFDDDLYGKYITVCFEVKLRDERRFDSVEELVRQLHTDRQEAAMVLKHTHYGAQGNI